MPKRIQRKRTKGWRLPDGAVYVGRPTSFGNPMRVGMDMAYPHPGRHYSPFWQSALPSGSYSWFDVRTIKDAAEAVDLYRKWLEYESVVELAPKWLGRLRGKDLACWCPLDQPCHADVLLELANT